ncbi:MAG: lytic transglycosylase domain-containing protein [Proteobacteria bacterium]|nr:lytic transglycosylase domain-containing protein [Pseudomonadota bacterium]
MAPLERMARVVVADVGQGLVAVSHNALALLGLLVVVLGLYLVDHKELRHQAERTALGWLQDRHGDQLLAEAAAEDDALVADAGADPGDPLANPLAADPATLNRQQAAVASWLSRRYKVAQEPIARLVHEAWAVGKAAGLDPTLILSIMAIESSFNPFAQSAVGAQGLMQVMTRVHNDKYQPFGGVLTAFDPVTNLRVGVQVLKECITRAGSLEAGLRYYVGAANLENDNGYAGKVLAEQAHLRRVAAGQKVPVNAVSAPRPAPVPASAAAPAASAPTAEVGQQLALAVVR